jgi:hypothetical protein
MTKIVNNCIPLVIICQLMNRAAKKTKTFSKN